MSSELKVFISHSREDEELRAELVDHLMSLERQGLIKCWFYSDISAGTEWKQEIERYLKQSDIILLLISPSYIASEYHYSTEMKLALDRHKVSEARVIPVILSPVADWENLPFGKLKA